MYYMMMYNVYNVMNWHSTFSLSLWRFVWFCRICFKTQQKRTIFSNTACEERAIRMKVGVVFAGTNWKSFSNITIPEISLNRLEIWELNWYIHIIYRTRAIITRRLYNFYPIFLFHCGLYYRPFMYVLKMEIPHFLSLKSAVYTRERLLIKRGL